MFILFFFLVLVLGGLMGWWLVERWSGWKRRLYGRRRLWWLYTLFPIVVEVRCELVEEEASFLSTAHSAHGLSPLLHLFAFMPFEVSLISKLIYLSTLWFKLIWIPSYVLVFSIAWNSEDGLELAWASCLLHWYALNVASCFTSIMDLMKIVCLCALICRMSEKQCDMQIFVVLTI